MALLAAPLLSGCYSGPVGQRIRLAGAQVPVELTASWLTGATRPSFVTEQVPPIYLSQHGFEALLNGECDLACTDRQVTPRELANFGEMQIAGRRVAFYGYALYVHPSNPLDAIYSGHMKLVFQRRIRDWTELAGPQLPQLMGPISLYGPAKSTRAGMVLSPLARIWFAEATWQVKDSDEEIVAAVANDSLALGFASIGYDDRGVRYLGLRMERRGKAAYPSIEEIEREEYGLAKLVYLYYYDPPTPAVQAVLEFLESDAGRRAVEGTSLWTIPPERAAVPLPAAEAP